MRQDLAPEEKWAENFNTLLQTTKKKALITSTWKKASRKGTRLF